MIGALWIVAALHQPPVTVTPNVTDILAGYKAWDLSCDASACSTQASDQITTITLRRSAAGLAITLASRRCPETTPERREFIPAKRLRPGGRKRNNERSVLVYTRFIGLEMDVLQSCGRAGTRPGLRLYDVPLVDRFLRQSDAVAAPTSRRSQLREIADTCGLPAGALRLSGRGEVRFRPSPETRYEVVDCALVQLRDRGLDKRMAFVGNETPAQENGKNASPD